jgi:acetyltransferase-like isoleucine patch superfamily enzyme
VKLIHNRATVSPTAQLLGRGIVQIGAYCTIEDNVVIDLGSSGRGVFILGSRSKIKIGSVLRCYENKLVIGHRVTLGNFCVVSAHGGIEIGEYTMTGPHCVIHAADHTTEGAEPMRLLGEMASGIVIGRDCWIGAHAVILDGVSIGEGSIVGAGAIVNRSIEPNTIAYGVPARAARNRSKS